MTSIISVIVPVYNAETYLDRCVESIRRQTYSNLEIILIDDGSTDSSSKKCDEYALKDNRIKVIHKKNGGVSSARNEGINVATGDYIGFVDSDDYISPNMYEILIRTCNKYNSVATISSYQEAEDGSISVRRKFFDGIVSTEDFLRNILLRKDGTAVWSRLFPKEIIGDSRFIEDRLNEEILFWMSIIHRIHNVCYISDVCYYYNQRLGSLSHQFGKNAHDMIGNALDTRMHITKLYPGLSKEVERFEIFQHMSFLLSCPSNYNRNADSLYGEVISYIKKNVMIGIKNPYLTIKEKVKLLGVTFCPRIMSILVEKKERKANEKTKK